MHYDSQNIFAKILRKEIPCNAIYENDHVLAFHDISPAAPVHVLVIPKGEYVNYGHFMAKAPDAVRLAFFDAVREIADQLTLHETGYRLITNHGRDASQSVPHFHVHILGGRPLGGLLPGDSHAR